MSTDLKDTTVGVQTTCLVKNICFFAKQAYLNHKPSVTKYRTRFEEAEVNFMYWDIEFIHLNYKKQNSNVIIRLRCTALSTGKEMYAEEQTVSFLLSEITKTTTNSWGHSTGGYWKADQYLWELYINGSTVLSKTIIIDKMGMVTDDENPYFDVLETKLFPGYIDNSENVQGYRYLTQFNCSETEYVGIELALKRKFIESKNLEFVITIIHASSGLVYLSDSFGIAYQATQQPAIEYTRFRHGAAKNNYWVNGSYLFYISFMNVTIAAGQFTIGNDEIAGAAKLFDKAMLPPATKTPVEKQKASVESALTALDELTGMVEVKKAIRENIEYLRFNKLRMEKGFSDDSQSNLHSIFTGNPGTGKTTVVRLLGKIYNAMGLLSKGHVIEATRADLVAEFIGQTAPKTKAMIEKARGGILFIDEVYSLARQGSTNDFGDEVVEILLMEMSSGTGNIAIIGAGYPAEVEFFLNSNPGLKSRFGRYFHFEDYMPVELMEIADHALKIEQASLCAKAKTELEKIFTNLYRNRDKYFGNGRLAFSIIDEAKKHMGIRLMKLDNVEKLSAEDLGKIELEDLLKVFDEVKQEKLKLPVNEEELNEAMQELDSMVGLQQIKQEIRDKISLVRFYSDTGENVLNKFSLHAILTGNPGTGKTTLARILGKIYKALGLLERGHITEVDRKNLVAGYVGQTALKTTEAIEQAMGGILFIDEAYALTEKNSNDFGSEAIETILKMMEDQRGKFAVIAAGYPDNMNNFAHSNPGLQSRFDAVYHLQDYTSEELLVIVQNLLSQHNLVLQADALQYLSGYIKDAYETRDKYFGNARFARQTVDSIITKQNLRLAALPREQRVPELLKQVTIADVTGLKMPPKSQRQTIGFKRS
ncbi:MAG: AAA family ATPase [Chitinophagaceae bacterium]